MGKNMKEISKSFHNPISDKYNISKLYINRELSWLEFNKRVLMQTIRKDVPLLERCNFLGITTSNLDEFIMVRFATIVNALHENHSSRDISGMTKYEEHNAVLNGIYKFKEMQKTCYDTLIHKLEKNDIIICKYDELDKDEKGQISRIFYKEIYPLLTPMNYDTTKEFPALKSKQMNIVVSVEDRMNNNIQVISFISLDESLNKIYKVPSKDKKIDKFIMLEDIIYHFLDRIYVGKNIVSYGSIKLLREADIELDHDKDIYITDRMRRTLEEREYSNPIFMDVSENMSKSLMKLLIKIFNLNKKYVYVSDVPYDYTVLQQIQVDTPGMRYNKFSPQYPSELIGEHDMFTAIDSGDIILHHPYQSFDPVIKFLEHAAYDDNVLSIKQTLYRVSSLDSPIVNALCAAAINGKQVSVMLEIKARFDEERNISLISKLKNSGCKLIYGVEDLKTHCKFITVVRKSDKGLKIYSHIGTGNYNDKTAKLYTDVSYFTSNFKIGQDLITVFNMLSGFSEPNTKINKIYFSPYNLRKKLYNCIDNEIRNAKNGKIGYIALKMNSISDKGVIDKLYEASRYGVKVIIFCRGICSIKPINKNIVIRSLVGRFLEHSRIYYFGNGKKPQVFISSADLLTRNLDKRFELLFEVKDDDCKSELLKILSMYYKDTFNTYKMEKNGIYEKFDDDKNDNIHKIFMEEAIQNYKLKNIPKMMSFKKK